MTISINQAIKPYIPGELTQKNVTFGAHVIIASARIVRMTVEISRRVFLLSESTILLGKGTYFVSAIKLPTSIYYLSISVLDFNQCNSFNKILSYTIQVSQKIAIIGKDIMNLLKGLKAFGCLHERYFWILKPSPIFCMIGIVGLSARLYNQLTLYSICQSNLNRYDRKRKNPVDEEDIALENLKNKLKLAKLGSLSAGLDLAGIALLVLTPLVATPVAIPAYSILTISSIASFSKVILSG